jgi:predicted ester cyclase
MSTLEENKRIVRSFIEATAKGDLAALQDLVAPGYTRWISGQLASLRGAEGYIRLLEKWLNVFPDISVTIDDVVAEGDRVACRLTWTGTHQGDWPSVPLGRSIRPTGRKVTFSNTIVSRLEGSQIAEEWEDWGHLEMLVQMGAIQPSGAS